MPNWIIVLSSAIGAVVLATALAVGEVVNAPRSDITTILMPHLPVLRGRRTWRVRPCRDDADDHKLGRQYDLDASPSGRAGLARTPAWQDWIAALGSSGSGDLQGAQSSGNTGERGL